MTEPDQPPPWYDAAPDLRPKLPRPADTERAEGTDDADGAERPDEPRTTAPSTRRSDAPLEAHGAAPRRDVAAPSEPADPAPHRAAPSAAHDPAPQRGDNTPSEPDGAAPHHDSAAPSAHEPAPRRSTTPQEPLQPTPSWDTPHHARWPQTPPQRPAPWPQGPHPVVRLIGPRPAPRPEGLTHIPLATGAAPAPALAALTGAAVLITAAVTSGGLGLGIPIAGAALLTACLPLAPRDHRAARVIGAVLSLALLTVPAVRDADWLALLCLSTGLGGIAATLAPPYRLTGLLCGPAGLLGGMFGGATWAGRGLAKLPGRDNAGRIARTALIGMAVVIVFGALFASADTGFARVVSYVLPDDSTAVTVRAAVFPLAALLALALAHTAVSPPRMDLVGARPARPVRRWEWAVPVLLLDALYAAFVAVQAVTFFGGDAYVQETYGLTYAQYARGGFWQLSWITGLTLALIGVVMRKAPRGDRGLIRLLLGVLCVLGLVVIASALHRMSLYAGAYGLTRLRVWIFAVELWLGVVYLLVMLAGLRLRGRWLARAVVASGAATLIALAAVNPDALIARWNIRHYAETGVLDAAYLASLSADAVPEFAKLPEDERQRVLARHYCAGGEDGFFAWNLSRSRGC